MPDSIHYELQYLDLMRRIWVEGDERVDRTGVGTRSPFGETMRFSLKDDAIPLLTTKRVYWKTALRELLWFLTGGHQFRPLIAQGVRIWTEWPLDRYRRETGEGLFRRAAQGHNQIAALIDGLRTNPGRGGISSPVGTFLDLCRQRRTHTGSTGLGYALILTPP